MQKSIEINQGIIERFSALNGKDKLAHAYLCVGPHDIGKVHTALGIAKMVNCEQDSKAFCDSCPSCLKINTGNHPDIMLIEEDDGGKIKIEKIRAILEQCKLRPYLARRRVIILRNAERLTPEAANAFLKTLEEPSGQSLMLLTTSVPEKCLDTIKSRCHMVYFQAASLGDLAKTIQADYQCGDMDSRCISYFANGSPKTARRLSEEKFIEQKNALIDAYILKRPSDNLVKSLIGDKAESKAFLDVLFSWVRDALLIKAGVHDDRIINLDRAKDLKAFTGQFTFEELNELSESIIKMHRLLADNLNIKLPLLIIGEQIWEA